MPQEFHIDETQQVIWTRCSGVLADADIAEHQAHLRADPKFQPTLHQLVDTREVTEVTLSLRTIRNLGQSQLFSPQSKRAYVVSQDVLFGLVRMYELYQSMRGTQNVRVFRNRTEAVAWLGVNDPVPLNPPATPVA